MAKYLILIYGQESAAAPTPDQWDQMMQAHGQFAQAVDQQGGKILGGEALQPTATATSVRNDGQAVTDGPFVETKEALGGFYLYSSPDVLVEGSEELRKSDAREVLYGALLTVSYRL